MVDINLAAPCGMYCGTCRSYLLLKKNLLKEKGYKHGCKGCRIQGKNCAHIKKDCQVLRKNEIDFCFECENFPCQRLERLDSRYKMKYNVSFIINLERNRAVGAENWLREQEILYTCPECEGEICVHDAECFDCSNKFNPNKKK
ncbi:MAG: DUF3795 domain-containing protein [Promethearchaeota archaeon]|jgi:hypothetical protein